MDLKFIFTVEYHLCLGLIHWAKTNKKCSKLFIPSNTPRGLLSIARFCTILNEKVDSWYLKSCWEPNWNKAKSVLTVRYLACLGLNHTAHTDKKRLELVMLSTMLRVSLDMARFFTILNGKVDSWCPKNPSEPNRKRAKLIRNPLTVWRVLCFILTLFVFLHQAIAFLVWAKPKDGDRC